MGSGSQSKDEGSHAFLELHILSELLLLRDTFPGTRQTSVVNWMAGWSPTAVFGWGRWPT